MTRQNYGDRVRRTQSHWQRENGDEREPPSGYVPYEDAKRQHERGANGPSDHNKHQSRIKLVPFDEIRIDTSRPYLIKGLIPLDGLTVIWGPPKSGKSFWTFDLTMHVALGWDYRGRRVQQGPVVYCAFEGQSGIKRRVEAFRQKHLAEEAEPVPCYFQPMMLDLVKECRELVGAVRSTLGETSPAVVVLDTLNRSLRGSENSDEDMSAYIKAADAIREGFNCAVIIVHHCGVNETRPRGHTSLTGAIAAQLAVKRDANKSIVVTVEWMKDGDTEGEETVSILEQVEVGIDEDGEPITSCVVMPTDAEPIRRKSRRSMSAGQQLGYEALVSLAAQHGEPLPTSYKLPLNILAVSVTAFKNEMLARGIVPADAKNPRSRLNEIIAGLKRHHVAAERNDRIWPITG